MLAVPVNVTSNVHFRPGGTPARVTRSGANLTLNGAPYRFVGFNLWRAAVASWNVPPNSSYAVNDGTTLADTLTAINAGGTRMNVFRCWFFQQFALNSAGDNTPSLPYRWDAFDKVLSVADAAGFKVLACLFDNWNYERNNTNGNIAASWYTGGYSTTAQLYEAVPYRQYVSDVTAHYAGDSRILGWELVNEDDVSGGGSCPGTAGSIMSSFVADNGGVIKANDPGALVSVGCGGEVCGQDGADYSTVHGNSCVDLCSFHDYTGAADAGGTWGGGNGLDNVATRAAALGKPAYIGECGIHLNTSPVSGSASARATYLDAKMNTAFNTYSGVAGYLPWHFDVRGVGSDDYNYPPSDPALAVMGAYCL